MSSSAKYYLLSAFLCELCDLCVKPFSEFHAETAKFAEKAAEQSE